MTNPIIFMYKNNIKHRRPLIFLRCQNCLSESYSSYDKYFYYILYIFAYCTYNHILTAQSNVLNNKNNIHYRLFAFSFPQKRKHIQSVPHFFKADWIFFGGFFCWDIFGWIFLLDIFAFFHKFPWCCTLRLEMEVLK